MKEENPYKSRPCPDCGLLLDNVTRKAAFSSVHRKSEGNQVCASMQVQFLPKSPN